MFRQKSIGSLTCLLICGLYAGNLDAWQPSKDLPKKNATSREVYDSEKRLDGFLTPQKSLAALKLPSGFHATLFSAEPDVRQPIAGTTDAKGRLWICENYTYSESKINFDLSLSDRIIILEDTDQDGRADARKVFWDQGKRLTSIALGFDGVYVTCAPNLLFIPDRNHDDVPDGPAEILLDGWNDDAVRHNIVNGLMWGPDGWLYGRHGIMATSFVGRPGDTPSQRVPINCGIWRYHPLHKKVEVVAHGTTNPWGMDFNNEGDLFMINTVIGHLWHVVPGARYDRMYGSHFNPYTYRTIQQTADHFHWNKAGGEAWHDTKKKGVTAETDRFGGGHAHCGLLFYGDDHWPAEYRNTLFTCNLHGLRINNDRLEPKGNGYVGKHNPDFAKSTDQWFRGIEMVRSHDQGFYLLDWQDTGECHENDGVHRSSGRIYKIRYGFNREKIEPVKLNHLDDKSLRRIAEKDRWHFQQALMEMRTRLARNKGEKKQLRTFLGNPNSTPIDSMIRQSFASDWGTERVYTEDFLTGANVVDWSQPFKSEQDRWIREWLNVCANDFSLSKKRRNNAELLNSIAKHASPRTRLSLASCLRQFEPSIRFSVASQLLAVGEDRDDNMQPLMIWYAIEPLVCKFPEKSVELIMSSQMPIVTELIARRLTEEIGNRRIAAQLVKLVETVGKDARQQVLRGMASALKGRRKVESPAGWTKLVTSLKLGKSEKDLVQQIQVVFGDGQTLENVRKTAADRNADPRMRGQAFLTLAENQAENLKTLLDRHLGDREVRQYVIEAYAYCDDPKVAEKILNQFQRLKPAGKKAAINTLTKRESWAQQLLHAIEVEKVARSHISAWHARQIENMGNRGLSEQLNRVWGTVRKSSSEIHKDSERIKSLLAKSQTDAKQQQELSISKGRKLFEKSCGNCHVLFGSGGKIGPDLTGSNRKDLGYLLENILDPNSSVAESFRASIIDLDDGRTITGVILEESSTTIRVQTAEKAVILDRQSVERIKKTEQSLMPDGLLKDFDDQSIRSLFEFLQSN